MNYNQIILVAYVLILVIMSLISFILFKKDKKIATTGQKNRIKEKTLLESVALGGAFGAFIGRIICHHKTDKKYFSLTIYFSLLLEALVLITLIALMF